MPKQEQLSLPKFHVLKVQEQISTKREASDGQSNWKFQLRIRYIPSGILDELQNLIY